MMYLLALVIILRFAKCLINLPCLVFLKKMALGNVFPKVFFVALL